MASVIELPNLEDRKFFVRLHKKAMLWKLPGGVPICEATSTQIYEAIQVLRLEADFMAGLERVRAEGGTDEEEWAYCDRWWASRKSLVAAFIETSTDSGSHETFAQ